MGLMDFLSKQFIEVIQWTESEPGVLAYRYPTLDLEIKNGAQLTVRESQQALFVNEGKVADIFGPGQYRLTTQTLPILTYLRNWDKAFESPFKSDVYFLSNREQTNQTWGTATPITLRDQEFGVLRIRAHGTYSYKIGDVAQFWAKLSGTTEKYTVHNIEGQLRASILTALASFLGRSNVAFLDMAANQQTFSDELKNAVAPALSQYGLQLQTFLVQSLSLPEELQLHLDRRASMGILGDLQKYARFQAADSISVAAANPGGIAAAGAGLGAGVAMGQAMTGAFSDLQLGGDNGANKTAADPIAMLEKLGELFKKGILTQAEFDAKKAELLQQIK